MIVQDLYQDLGSGKTKQALADFDAFITMLPDTLTACGQSDLAKKVQKYFPIECLLSINDLAKELSTFEHNYDHFEWLFKHRK